jgi:hypothetical protein
MQEIGGLILPPARVGHRRLVANHAQGHAEARLVGVGLASVVRRPSKTRAQEAQGAPGLLFDGPPHPAGYGSRQNHPPFGGPDRGQHWVGKSAETVSADNPPKGGVFGATRRRASGVSPP